MPLLFQYLLKLSCSLALVYFFYQLLLRRLTFYTANRWYLLGYSLLCFFIPFINIAGFVEQHELSGSKMVRVVPVLENYTRVSPNILQKNNTIPFTVWDCGVVLFAAVAVVLFGRLLLQALSYCKMRNRAQLLADDGVRLYQVDQNVTPFSFGCSIFINPRLHGENELKEIMRHEFVHVRQRHTVDIIWAEVLCILNWYNPFAWLLRRSIRQNLEFIADDKVVQSGVDKKHYQYLLLKVMGASQFSIAAPFNFSSLKKRIVMMNKMKSAKAHLVKFLFMLPLLAVLLLAFRSQQIHKKENRRIAIATTDTMPAPPPVVTPVAPTQEVGPGRLTPPAPIVGLTLTRDTLLPPQDYKSFFERNPSVKNIRWTERTMIIELKSGKEETYRLGNEKSMAEAERKWGKLPVAPPLPPPPPAVIPPVAPITADTTNLPVAPNDLSNAYKEKLDFLKEKIAELDKEPQNGKDSAQVKAIKDYLQQEQIAMQRQQAEMQKNVQGKLAYIRDEQGKQALINQKKIEMLNVQQQKILLKKIQAQEIELQIRKQQMQGKNQQQQKDMQIRLQEKQEIKKNVEAKRE